MNVLFVAPYPHQAADTRYRIAQYFPGLRQAGIQCTLRPFMSGRFYQIYASNGSTAEKLAQFALAQARRLWDVIMAGHYDAVFLHKEAFPFGPPLIEGLLKARAGKLIYDLDDAFWTHPPQLKQFGRYLRDPQKVIKVLKLSDHTIAGNSYIAEQTAHHNPVVTVIPTVVDTRVYLARDPDTQVSTVTIGWVGRWSSAFYLDALAPALSELCRRYAHVRVKLIGAGPKSWPGVRLISEPWRLETELADLQDIDIGIMPLPNDEYSRYKSGFKMLQYMSLGIPAVVTPVGMNQDVICDGQNGFLASTTEEWVDKLARLIEEPALRRRLGAAGRRTIEERYSLQHALAIMRGIIEEVVHGG